MLAREVKELIAAFVATEAGCQYCAGAHSLLAQMIGASPQIVAATQASSVADMPVDDKLRARMQFVSQIDQAAYRITDDDLERLRDRGWSDAQLLEAVWTACIFNAVVRLVDNFGLSVVGQFLIPNPGREGTGSLPPARIGRLTSPCRAGTRISSGPQPSPLQHALTEPAESTATQTRVGDARI